MNRPQPCCRSFQQGVLLLQSLVALALFSVGALAVLMLSANAMRQAAEAHYRTAASVLAAQLVSQIRLGPRDAAAIAAITTGPDYGAFKDAAARALPGASQYPPLVAMDGTGRLAITLRWQRPGDTAVHQYVALTRVTE